MTYEESITILHGDATGLEFMSEEVYNLCQFITDICLFYDHGRPELVEWANAFIVSYEETYGIPQGNNN